MAVDPRFEFTEPPRTERPSRKPTYRVNKKQLLRCWECDEPIGRTARFCPHCGADQKKRPPPQWVVVVVLSVAVVLVVAALIAMDLSR